MRFYLLYYTLQTYYLNFVIKPYLKEFIGEKKNLNIQQTKSECSSPDNFKYILLQTNVTAVHVYWHQTWEMPAFNCWHRTSSCPSSRAVFLLMVSTIFCSPRKLCQHFKGRGKNPKRSQPWGPYQQHHSCIVSLGCPHFVWLGETQKSPVTKAAAFVWISAGGRVLMWYRNGLGTKHNY